MNTSSGCVSRLPDFVPDWCCFCQLVESFGAGTAAIVSPVSAIGYNGRDLQIPVGEDSAQLVGRKCGGSVAELVRDKILDIQYGVQEHPFSVVLD